ncbi:hypothetical protein JCM12141A_57870 [Mycolicibacterium hodleri]
MQGERARLAGFFGVDDGALDARSVADPDAAAGVDIVAILGADGLPKRNALRRNGLRGRYGARRTYGGLGMIVSTFPRRLPQVGPRQHQHEHALLQVTGRQ